MGNKCNCKCIQDTLIGGNELNTLNNNNNQQTINKEGSLSTNLTNLEHFETSKNDEKKLKAGNKPNKNNQNFNSIEENNAEYDNYNSYNNGNKRYDNNNNNNQFNYDYYNNDNLNILDFNNTNNNNNNNSNNYSNNEYVLNSNNNLNTNKNKNDLPITSSNNVDSQIIKSTMFYDKQIDENEKNSQPMNKILDETADAHLTPSDDFSNYIFNKINDIRQNPQKYISVLEDAKNNITTDKKTEKLIYKSPNSKVKVALNRGADAFDEAIMFLNNLEPMNPLIYHPLITINAPDNELDLKNKDYLKDEVNRIENKNIYIKSFFRDIVKEPETSFILLIADDSKNSGVKRKDILDRNQKYIGIVSKKIEKSFACYITFADYN
jgi:hypothetical protein